ncbi:MAG: IS66 family transposase [Candidatus Omnitrophota bacterium]|nr:IS66 family transposase [Candidatus Methanoperedenaceae archaeon]
MAKLFSANKGGDSLGGMVFCSGCLKKQQKIDSLEEEIASLRMKLRYREKKEQQEFFGSSTPSSKKKFKEKSSQENQKKQGGAKKGHKGNGRRMFTAEEADEIVDYELEMTHCPDCNVLLGDKSIAERPVIEGEMLRPKKILFRSETKRCPKCRKIFNKKLPVLKRNKYGTQFVSNSAIMHYLHSIPLKRVEDLWGNDIVAGNLIKTFHRIGGIFNPMMELLKKDYREAEVKHADETGWRTDGANGYGWLFTCKHTSIFDFRDSRSAKIILDILGEDKLGTVLVVDRYAAYNKAPCNLQYCYAHLLREAEDLKKEFPKESEIKNFVNCVAPLISKAMSLRKENISEKRYYKKAQKLKKKIMEAMNGPGKHAGVQKIQDIFREKSHRLFHWVENRNVPADNNYAERELRPTVIARKVSHGSQSKAGARTRSILMSVLHTVKKRLRSGTVEDWLNETLQKYIHNPDIDLRTLLPAIPDD